MKYTHEITLITPIVHVETARSISRALDPDVGGAEAFQMMLSSDGSEPATHAAYNTPCSDQFLSFLELPPEQIYAMVVADYERRWGGFEPPTLDAVAGFMESLVAVADTNIYAVIEEQHLQVCVTGLGDQ